MDQIESQRFINTVLMGLWTDWEPTAAETKAWQRLLLEFDYETAEEVINKEWSRGKRMSKRPVPGVFLEQAKLLQAGNLVKSGHREPVCLYTIERQDRRDIRRFFHASGPLPDSDSIMADAEKKRVWIERAYGGQWISVIGTKEPVADDGLRGLPAKEKAEAKTLAGPDCPAKRFLLAIRDDKSYTERLGRAMRAKAWARPSRS